MDKTGAGARAGARAINSNEAMLEIVDRWPMRQVAHICVTSAAEKTLKSPLLDSFLAENRWSNRHDGEKSLVTQMVRRSLQMLQK
jgi:hypothetical protein